MENFADSCRRHGARTLAAFGDSITEGAGASAPENAWPDRLGRAIGARVLNRGIGGTVLQSTPVHDGRGDSGLSRYRRDLLGAGRADAIAILYGYNDARYTADPERFNVVAFSRDYRTILAALLAAGYDRDRLCLGSPPYPSDLGLSHGGPGFTGQSRAGFEAYRDAVRNLAAQYDLFYAPVYEAMAAHPDRSLAAADITHPNDEGHRVIAAAFAAATKPLPR